MCGDGNRGALAEIDGAAYVLDNRQKRPMPWTNLPYTWDRILDKSGQFWTRVNPNQRDKGTP